MWNEYCTGEWIFLLPLVNVHVHMYLYMYMYMCTAHVHHCTCTCTCTCISTFLSHFILNLVFAHTLYMYNLQCMCTCIPFVPTTNWLHSFVLYIHVFWKQVRWYSYCFTLSKEALLSWSKRLIISFSVILPVMDQAKQLTRSSTWKFSRFIFYMYNQSQT